MFLDDSSELKEKCLTWSPLRGNIGWEQMNRFFTSVFYVLSAMYGYIDTSRLTADGKPLTEDSEVLFGYVFQWFITSTLTTLILMNLLVGLAIGDVRSIEENADCMIIQIELKRMFRRKMKQNFCCCFCKCFGTTCRAKKPVEDVQVFFPNKSKKKCSMNGEKKSCSHFLGPKQYTLGCHQVRKSILGRYKKLND